MSEEYACGQILFTLKNSNLHYILKETHISAQITIKKKFIKQSEDALNTNNIVVNNVKKMDDKIRMENGILKQEINDLKTRIANIEIESEEAELKNESLKRTIASVDMTGLRLSIKSLVSLKKLSMTYK